GCAATISATFGGCCERRTTATPDFAARSATSISSKLKPSTLRSAERVSGIIESRPFVLTAWILHSILSEQRTIHAENEKEKYIYEPAAHRQYTVHTVH